MKRIRVQAFNVFGLVVGLGVWGGCSPDCVVTVSHH